MAYSCAAPHIDFLRSWHLSSHIIVSFLFLSFVSFAYIFLWIVCADSDAYWTCTQVLAPRLIASVSRARQDSATPEMHMLTVWDSYVRKAAAKDVAVVAHSFGGVVTVNLVSCGAATGDLGRTVLKISARLGAYVEMLSLACRGGVIFSLIRCFFFLKTTCCVAEILETGRRLSYDPSLTTRHDPTIWCALT